MKASMFAFTAIGTKWSIDIFDHISLEKKKALLAKIHALIDEFDLAYSRFNKKSLVTKISQEIGEYKFPTSAEKLFDISRTFYRLTNGAFTPLIGNVMEEAGYDSNYSLNPKLLRKPFTWEEAIMFKDSILTVSKPVMLDFGALGKGYLVDLVSELLKENGIITFCVDAGGDMYYFTNSNKSLSVGLEHPKNPKQVIGIAKILNESICGSSGNRRKWDKFHHIINPHTLKSPQNILSAWVIADSAILADALATCLFFVDPKVLSNDFSFEFLLLNADYSTNMSQAFPAEIYYNK